MVMEYDNDVDLFPLDPSEWADFDGDGVGDNADLDDDNDLVLDVNDAFPMDPSKQLILMVTVLEIMLI